MSDSPEIKAWTSAYLVAIALQSTFPHVQELKVGLMGNYIHIHCKLPFQLRKDFFSLIEEKIRSYAKSKEMISFREMVPISAAGYFKTKGIYELFEEIAHLPLIRFFEYDGLILLCNEELASSFYGLQYIKLIDLVDHDGTCSLLAAVGEDKQELKECIKKYQRAKEKNHLIQGQKAGFFTIDEEGVYWLPKGVFAKKKIEDALHGVHEESGFQEIEVPRSGDLVRSHLSFVEKTRKMQRIYTFQSKNLSVEFSEENGLFEYPFITEGVSSVFCRREEIEKECISSLHFAKKISTILDFYGSYVLFCPAKMKTSLWEISLRHLGLSFERRKSQGNIPKLEYQVKDGYGRSWTLFSLELAMISEELCHIVCCNLPSLERVTALMLENEQITG